MNRRKVFVFVFLLIWFLSNCCFPVFAAEELKEQTDAEAVFSEIYEAVDADTKSAIADLGLNEISYESLLSLSPRAVITELLEVLTGKLKEPLRAAGLMLAFVVLYAVLSGFTQQKGDIHTIFSLFSTLWIVMLILPSVSETLVAAFSTIQLCADFMLVYIPGFAGIIAMSGKPLTSAAYSSVMVGLSNLFSAVQMHALLPIAQVFFMLNVLNGIESKFSFDSIAACFKKLIQITLGVFSAVFTGLLAIKGSLAASGDSVTIKGVKTLVGSTVPIVGSALGDSLTSVLGSISLIKSTVGIFGILVIALINVPVVLDLLLWYFAISFSAAVSGALGLTSIKKMLDGIAATVSLVNVFVIFTAFLFIVSTGIILQFRG